MLATLFGYDALKRGLIEQNGETHDYASSIDELVARMRTFSADMNTAGEIRIAKEFGQLLRFRTIFFLLPEECLFGSPDEDKPIIRKHLRCIGVECDESLGSAIKFFCTNFRQRHLLRRRKLGITDLFAKHRHLYSKLMLDQKNRCAVCGVVLHYGENAELDHVLPWHLGNDPPDGSNWQILCSRCNRGKGEYPHYALTAAGANWIGPGAQQILSPAVRYAALLRDEKCAISGAGPTQVELIVIKRFRSGCWILDNVIAVSKAVVEKEDVDFEEVKARRYPNE